MYDMPYNNTKADLDLPDDLFATAEDELERDFDAIAISESKILILV